MRLLKASWEATHIIVRALLIAGFIIVFLGRVTIVMGQSMEPTLTTDQRLIIERVSYQFYEPQRGDIVVLEIPSSEIPLIKRVVGLAGETVAIEDNQVFINGELLSEPYLLNSQQPDHPATLVPAEHVFVMGDNRPYSRDSRAFGPVDIYRVTGRAWLSLWPPDAIGPVDESWEISR